jgi:DHA1 family multidrug resistance protein-like MFS transporter
MGLFAILSSTMSKNPVLKPFATSLGTPDELLGIVASASTIPGILISLPAASLSDIFGRRKVLLFAAFVFASAPFLYFFVNSWWTLALVRFYHGFATAIFVPVAEASVAELYPTKRGERISIFNSAMSVGRALAPFLGGYILFATASSYFSLYLAVGVAGVTALVIAVVFLAENRSAQAAAVEPSHRRMFGGWLYLLRNGGVLGVSFVQAVQYYVYGAVEFFLVGYLTDVVRLDIFLVGIITGSQIVALVVARPFIGRISDKTGRTKPIVLGTLISGILVGAIPFTTQFPILLALAVGYGVSYAAVLSSTSPTILELVPASMVGASLGFLATWMDIGQTLGPIISGVIFATSLQYLGLFLSLSLLLAVSIVVFLFSKRRRQPKPQI